MLGTGRDARGVELQMLVSLRVLGENVGTHVSKFLKV